VVECFLVGIVLFPLGEVADVPLAFHVSGPSGCALHYFDHIQTLAQNPLRSNAESKPLSYV